MRNCDLCGNDFITKSLRRKHCDACVAHPAYDRLKHKNNSTKAEHGMTVFEAACLLKLQGNKCVTCGTQLDLFNKPVKRGEAREMSGSCLDHCHTTGRFRGIICFSCNLALGYVKDNQQTLRNMIDYLNPPEQLELPF